MFENRDKKFFSKFFRNFRRFYNIVGVGVRKIFCSESESKNFFGSESESGSESIFSIVQFTSVQETEISMAALPLPLPRRTRGDGSGSFQKKKIEKNS
jgi:hypothetical protein